MRNELTGYDPRPNDALTSFAYAVSVAHESRVADAKLRENLGVMGCPEVDRVASTVSVQAHRAKRRWFYRREAFEPMVRL